MHRKYAGFRATLRAKSLSFDAHLALVSAAWRSERGLRRLSEYHRIDQQEPHRQQRVCAYWCSSGGGGRSSSCCSSASARYALGFPSIGLQAHSLASILTPRETAYILSGRSNRNLPYADPVTNRNTPAHCCFTREQLC